MRDTWAGRHDPQLPERETLQSPASDGYRRSASGRTPQWVIDEAAGRTAAGSGSWRPQTAAAIEMDWLDELADQVERDAATATGGADAAGDDRARWQHAPRRRGLWAVITAVTVAVVGAALLADAILGVADTGSRGAASSPLAAGPSLAYDLAGTASVSSPYIAAVGDPAAREPLGTASPLTSTGSSYAFLHRQRDGSTPVTWDPCRPLHYVVRTDGAPPGGAEIIAAAVARVSRATGLRFMYDGTTSEGPSEQRLALQRDTYGDRWVPALITWSSPEEVPALTGPVTGQAGSMPLRDGDNPIVYVSGQLALDAAQLAQILQLDHGREIATGVVLQELGHLVGLADVDDPSQLMDVDGTASVTDFGASDLTGLAALGAGACVPTS